MNTSSILTQLRSERDRLEKAIAALESLDSTVSAGRPAAAAKAPKRRTRRLTPAGRKRLSEMMKKRWAERRKKAGKPAAKTSPTRGRRHMSAAARRKIAAAQRKRWAAQKKAAKPAAGTAAS